MLFVHIVARYTYILTVFLRKGYSFGLLVHKIVYMYFEARLCMCAGHFSFHYGD